MVQNLQQGLNKRLGVQSIREMKKSYVIAEKISHNGYKLEEFVPQKTSAYISQYDQHIPKMTVREILDFSACCQGVVSRADVMVEVSKREKEAGIVPDPDIDTYMKAISVKGLKGTLQTDYILKILGLDICADTPVGDATRRGISSGQKRRLTTGEMIVGPTKALFMDEITNGVDSSTAFQIVTCIQQLVHITDATALVSLLQPAPETFDLFDDLILMSEGKIMYHGPRDHVLEFFEDCGFRCPERKGVAEFYPRGKLSLGKIKHSTGVTWKYLTLFIIACITMTVFLRTRMDIDVLHANYYMGSLFYALVILLVDGFPELSMTIQRLEVFYKQKAFCFYPAWAYAIPASLLKVPLSFVESLVWTALTYYVIGYSPEAERFFCQFILLFVVHLSSLSMFRFLASVFQTITSSMTAASMPFWLKWGFWVSPLTYGEIGLSLNEFLAPRWQKVSLPLHNKKSTPFYADTTANEQGEELVILWLLQTDQH
uniref:ABC transporter domain-containing protein n=1 Tax=Fagus sylvatica TaxID=28930 RepID=A0A2N9G2S1_FAGSY